MTNNPAKTSGRDPARGTRPTAKTFAEYHAARKISIGVVAAYSLRRFKTALLAQDYSETSRLVEAVDILLDYEEVRS